MDFRPSVTICICTYRREAVFDALRSVALLHGIAEYNPTVIVIDNDGTDALHARIDQFAKSFPLPLRYVHAPAKNISVARNAALDATATNWLLFMDDDEIADRDWLCAIMKNIDEYQAIIGPCVAVFDPSLPAWASRCDFHSNRISGRIENAYTSNALLDMQFVRGHDLRFRLELGRTGGEDTVFFHELAALGGAMSYCPDAIVYEPVLPARATMAWVKTRKFRAGQTHGLVLSEFNPKAFEYLWLTAGVKMIASLAMTIVSIPGSDRSRRWLARTYLHWGAFRYRWNPDIVEEYA